MGLFVGVILAVNGEAMVSNLMFYTQSTSMVTSGRWGMMGGWEYEQWLCSWLVLQVMLYDILLFYSVLFVCTCLCTCLCYVELLNCPFWVTQKANFHVMNLLRIINFFCICIWDWAAQSKLHGILKVLSLLLFFFSFPFARVIYPIKNCSVRMIEQQMSKEGPWAWVAQFICPSFMAYLKFSAFKKKKKKMFSICMCNLPN